MHGKFNCITVNCDNTQHTIYKIQNLIISITKSSLHYSIWLGYAQLYEKDLKEMQNRPMETTQNNYNSYSWEYLKILY